MSPKIISRIALTILLLILSVEAIPAVQVAQMVPAAPTFALKMFIVIVILLLEKSRADRDVKLQLVEQRMAAQNMLAKKVAHDIRSPLSALQLIVNTLHTDNKEQKQIISDVVTRINGIANDLLLADKKGIQVQPVEQKNVGKTLNLKGLVELLIKEKNALFPKVKFFIDVKSVDFKWTGCETILSRVLSNILNNSAESLSELSNIHVKAYGTQEFLCIEVVDFGCGIPEDVLIKLGSEQLTTKGSEGSGVGLYSAFNIVKSWGGDIQIQSRVGVGTKVTLRLPV